MEDREIVELFWARDEGAIPAAQERYGARLTALTERLRAALPEDGAVRAPAGHSPLTAPGKCSIINR